MTAKFKVVISYTEKDAAYMKDTVNMCRTKGFVETW